METEYTVIQKIKYKINKSKYGTVFFVSTFAKFNLEYVSKLLADFERQDLLIRISKGVYIKAKKTRFGIVYPETTIIVNEIAKRDKAKIIPMGNTAANRLGFSTQVPMNSEYLTSGSSRVLKLGKRKVTLRHGAPRNFAYKGKVFPELVQALRSIGKQNISIQEDNRIFQILKENPEEETIKYDLLLAPVWIRQLIEKHIINSSNE